MGLGVKAGAGTPPMRRCHVLLLETKCFGNDLAGAFAHEGLDLHIAVHAEGLAGEAAAGFDFYAADEAFHLRDG